MNTDIMILMSLITGIFFIFLCILLLMYYTLPKNFQWQILLAGSLFFYAYASPYYLIFIMFSAMITYYAGLYISGQITKDNISPTSGNKNKPIKAGNSNISSNSAGSAKTANSRNKAKTVLFLTILINLGILFALKYTNPFMEIVSSIRGVEFNPIKFIVPLGISFYTFMIISYIVDVYKGEITPEENFLKFLLYVSFFPQIIEGPINRYINMKDQLYLEHNFDFNQCKNASYRILQGLFKKVVIAGRFSVYVDRVFDNVQGYSGLTLLTATVFYVIQLYADFSGCMDLVIGIAGLFGIEMSENFNLPLFSKSVSEFWRRWHITLGAWFRDYIYYPVFRSEFSKKLKSILVKTPLKKQSMNVLAAVALFCVWFFTGLWHGGEIHYVVWGLYYAVILIFSLFMEKSFKKMRKNNPKIFESKWFDLVRIVRTLIIVTFGELIFRANNMRDAFYMMKKIVTDFSLSGSAIAEAILPFTEDNTAVAYGGVAILSFIALFVVELFAFNEKDTFKKHKYLNAAILIVVTLLFGVFGESGFLYMAY